MVWLIGIPASTHITKDFLAAVRSILAWSFQPGLHLYGVVLPLCHLTSSSLAFAICSIRLC